MEHEPGAGGQLIMSCEAVPHPPLLALALRGDRGVVEGEDVADGAGAAGVELVTLHITSQPLHHTLRAK